MSAETNHTTNDNWFVSGLLQVVTDPSSERTTGRITSYHADSFAETKTTGHVSPSGDVEIVVVAKRQISIEAEILSGSGIQTHVVWAQDLEYSNTQVYLNNFTVQVSRIHPLTLLADNT